MRLRIDIYVRKRRIRPPALKLTLLALFFSALAAPLAPIHFHSQAHAQVSHLLDSPLAKHVFKSEAGQSLMRRVLGRSARSTPTYEEFVTALRSGDFLHEQEEVLRAIRELADHADGFRRFRNPKAKRYRNRYREPRGEVGEFITYLSNHRLKLNDGWRMPRLRGKNSDDLARLGSAEEAEESWKALLAPKTITRADDFRAPHRDDGFLRRKARGIEATFARYSDCIASQRGDASRARFREYLLTDMALAQFFTGAGYITGTVLAGGVKDLSVADFLFEEGQAAMASVAYNFWVKGNLSFKKRWFRILMFGEARSVVDGFAYVYYSDAVGRDAEAAKAQAVDRFVFNSFMWNPMPWGAVKNTVMYNLVNGLNCLYAGPNSKIVRNTKFLRFFDSLGTAVLYFGVRHLYLELKDKLRIESGEEDIQRFIPPVVLNDPRPEDFQSLF